MISQCGQRMSPRRSHYGFTAVESPPRKPIPAKMRTRNLIAAAILGVAIVAGLGVALSMRELPETPMTATIVPPGDALPEFSLLNQHGDPVDREFFEGQWDLVFFGFTNCPDICPTTLQLLVRARDTLESAASQPLPRIVLGSVDPERDTPEVLARYTAAFGDGIVGLTGDLSEIETLTRSQPTVQNGEFVTESTPQAGEDLMGEADFRNHHECLSPGAKRLFDGAQIDLRLATTRDAVE